VRLVFTCCLCGWAEISPLYYYGACAILREWQADARAGGWSKTKHGWVHRRCELLARIDRTEPDVQLPPAPAITSARRRFGPATSSLLRSPAACRRITPSVLSVFEKNGKGPWPICTL
jgi:hypothetical protein